MYLPWRFASTRFLTTLTTHKQHTPPWAPKDIARSDVSNGNAKNTKHCWISILTDVGAQFLRLGLRKTSSSVRDEVDHSKDNPEERCVKRHCLTGAAFFASWRAPCLHVKQRTDRVSRCSLAIAHFLPEPGGSDLSPPCNCIPRPWDSRVMLDDLAAACETRGHRPKQ